MDPARGESRINQETRAFMTHMLELNSEDPNSENQYRAESANLCHLAIEKDLNLPIPSSGMPPHLSSIVSSLIPLIGRILEELEGNLPRLLSLNPSRRDAIAQHLEKLAGIPPRPSPPPTPGNQSSSILSDPTLGLRRWVEGSRTSAQNSALKTYFEEVAIIALGQALLLKNWSERGIRKWSQSDLGRLNWALSTALKPFIPLDRESWQLTRPNLYSWYNPSPRIQPEIWATLDTWHSADEGPYFLTTLLGPARRAQPEYLEASGYDTRFYQSLWNHIGLFGWDQNPQPPQSPLVHNPIVKRPKVVFSPTLRDGTLVRTGPQSIQWFGLESSHFQLMIAELMQIWWGPAAPPLWCIGSGIEVHAKDQLAFVLGSPKPTVLCRIAEMEACDAAFVLEEQTIRTQGRSASTVRFREQLECLPYFKRLRATGTSLGSLQTCVALSKLRPGGILLWAREEALGPKEGQEVLNFLLDRAKLICEWDFSELNHSLPVATPLHPQHLYLFQREANIEARLSHRPIRHTIQGQIRSHIEVPLVLEDAFQSMKMTELPLQSRGQWTLLSHPSPTSQRDWIENWPDPTSHSQVRHLDQLRAASLPLAHFTTIRQTPEGDPNRNHAWSVQNLLRGFWLTAGYENEGRKLKVQELPRPGQETQGNGFLVLVSDETWVAPLIAYLESNLVQQWLDYHAERRGDRWILNEQVVKWIPIPKPLLISLGVPHTGETAKNLSPPASLSREWEKWAAEVDHQPKAVREALAQLGHDPSVQTIHCTLFIRAARALEYLNSGQYRLFSLVTPDGRIRWRELLNVLPHSECVTLSVHPKIRLTGSLPPHLPIGRIDRVKSPSPGILLATESGFSLHIGSEIPLFINMVWEQLDGITNPTWSELLQYLRIPRKVELAESTALEVLRSHGEQSARLQDLRNLLSTCQLF